MCIDICESRNNTLTSVFQKAPSHIFMVRQIVFLQITAVRHESLYELDE